MWIFNSLSVYLQQRRMMLVAESLSSVILSIAWLCQCMLQEALGIRLFEHVGVPDKMKQPNEHWIRICSTFFGNERFLFLRTFYCIEGRFRYFPPLLPTFLPSYLPTVLPSYLPTFLPSYLPTFLPSFLPAFLPAFLPSFLSCPFLPSFLPLPSLFPFFPSFLPSLLPSFLPSFVPSFLPYDFFILILFCFDPNDIFLILIVFLLL